MQGTSGSRAQPAAPRSQERRSQKDRDKEDHDKEGRNDRRREIGRASQGGEESREENRTQEDGRKESRKEIRGEKGNVIARRIRAAAVRNLSAMRAAARARRLRTPNVTPSPPSSSIAWGEGWGEGANDHAARCSQAPAPPSLPNIKQFGREGLID